jgi:UPF0271 protein
MPSMNSKSGMDLNLDAGESAAALADGSEEQLYKLVKTVNIACGGHAGDASTMAQAVKLAHKHGLAIGAHPSFPDRASFGRQRMNIGHAELVDSLCAQIESLRAVVAAPLGHIKPHGALYNLAAFDEKTASAIIEAVKRVDAKMTVVGLAGSAFLKWCSDAGLTVKGEAFVDRRYEPDGRLRAREHADALIEDAKLAGEQARAIVFSHSVTAVNGVAIPMRADTLCIHGDTKNALAVAKEVRRVLEST